MIPEERLALDEIQGAVIPGFKKDYVAIVGLFIDDVQPCKQWLKVQASEVASASEVLAFNRLHKVMRQRRGSESATPNVVWKSIAFSADGLGLLRTPQEIKDFESPFVNGMFQSALGDPPGDEWVVGGRPEAVPHVLVVLAADVSSDLARELERLMASLPVTSSGTPAMHAFGPPQMGATLGGALRGHEHFGFKDGVSQPAVRGLASDDPSDFIEPRMLAADDPDFEQFAVPGRPLVWPGQFIIGYKRQDRLNFTAPRPPVATKVAWQRNGSYLVYRRLQQRVDLFWQFCKEGAKTLGQSLGRPVTSAAFAARLVGRWPSGAPIIRSPVRDDPAMATDDATSNNFLFTNEMRPVRLADGSIASAAFPPVRPDPDGRTCPFAAHIRKVNPRDDSTDTSGPAQTRTRLILRRGIPYGPRKKARGLLQDDGVDRGLLFISYQASIAEQFEFLTKTWVNRDNAPHDSDPPAGTDPLIGQSSQPRFVRLPGGGDPVEDLQVELPDPAWVRMTGGGYFFAPSITALSNELIG